MRGFVTTPNTAELVAIYQHIVGNPKEWRQRWYATQTSCGTAYCVAGHAVVRAGYSPVFDGLDYIGNDLVTFNAEKDGAIYDIERLATQLLGLTRFQADDLFRAHNSLNRIRELITEITGVDPESVTS